MIDRIRKKQEIQEVFNSYVEILKIKRPINLSFSKNKQFGGYYRCNKVTLNQSIFKNWDDNKKSCEFLIVHELVHAKYDDSNTILEGLGSVLFPKISIKLAFCELRANVIAYDITRSSEEDLKNYFRYFYSYSPIEYLGRTGGYLKGSEYEEFIQRYPTWTTKTVKEAATYFKRCSLLYRLVPENYYNKLIQEFF